jgi:hypothetical protein
MLLATTGAVASDYGLFDDRKSKGKAVYWHVRRWDVFDDGT